MKIKLPPKKNAEEKNPELEFDQLVIIGANGSGKTRFGSWIEEHNNDRAHRISAQKSLNMPSSVRTSSVELATEDFLYGVHNSDKSWLKNYGKKNNRWKGNFNTTLLNDYESLLVLLHTEEYNELLKEKKTQSKRSTTKLDHIKRIFEVLLPHRKLEIGAGIVEAIPLNCFTKYNGSEMSDGERYIFYIIAEVLCAPKNSIIIIDEPEIHIHNSLIKNLFDLIEQERSDCSFIYLTHNLDFAFSRNNAIKIWTKEYDGNEWDYEILNEIYPIPEHLYLEILGSRQPVLFIEGGDSSLDYEIYSQIFTDYSIKPLGSCNKVIEITKSFNEDKEFHNINSHGIIDRDRRSKIDINNLVDKNIWVLDVAEVENLLLTEEIIKIIANQLGKDPNIIFTEVKNNILTQFEQDLDEQVLLHFKEQLKREYNELTNFSSKNIGETISAIDIKYANIDKQVIFDNIKKEFQTLINNKDYAGILKVYNSKHGLLISSKIYNLTEHNKPKAYQNLVLSLLKKGGETREKLKEAIKKYIIQTPVI